MSWMNPVLRILRLVFSDVEECLVARDITGDQPRAGLFNHLFLVKGHLRISRVYLKMIRLQRRLHVMYTISLRI